MANTSVQLTMGMDLSRMSSQLKKGSQEAKQFSKEVQDALGQKLKQVISVVAIEQAVQRTAEWAAEIQKTSRALGVTNEQLQYIELMSRKSAVAEEEAVSMFENIVKAQQAALDGNTEMIASFAQLKISMQDIATLSKMELFKKFIMGAPTKPNDIDKAALKNISGTNIGSVYGMQSGGKNVSPNDIVDEESINSLAATWKEVTLSLRDIGISMIPIINIILGLTKTIINGLGAIVTFFMSIFNIIMAFIKGDFETIKRQLINIGSIVINALFFGLLKIVTGLVDIITNWVNKLTRLFGWEIPSLTEKLNKEQDDWNQQAGTSGRIQRQGDAVGQLAGMVASLPSGVVKGAVGTGARSAGEYLTNKGLTGAGGKLSKYGDDISPTIESVIKKESEQVFNTFDELIKKKGASPQAYSPGDKYRPISDEIVGVVSEKAKKAIKTKITIDKMKELAAQNSRLPLQLGSGAVALGSLGKEKGYKTPAEGAIPSVFGKSGFTLPDVGGGGSMLKFGGILGVGENKIIKLNQQMVYLLSMIQRNTSPFGMGNVRNTTNPAVNFGQGVLAANGF